MSDTIPTPLVDAMCLDDFMANHYADPAEFYVPAEFARTLERELAALKRGEFICAKCGLRKDGESLSPELRTW